MGNCMKRGCCCCCGAHGSEIPILILGLTGAGKTDIAFRMQSKKRGDFLTTNGCRMFSTNINKRNIKISELGGADNFYDIWKYYFLDVMGVIYVIDSTDQVNLEKSKQVFGSIMSNDLLMGKPFLILANKQDRPNAIDSLDICDYFEVEYLANLFQTPCLVEGVGRYQQSYDSEIVRNACSWLVKTICKNYKTIENKIRFLRIVTQSESVSSNEEIPRKNRRPATGKRKKKLRFSQSRPKTAPTSKLSFSRNHESFLTSSKHPSTLRAKKGNQISPLADNYPKFGYSCENTIGDGLKAGLMNGIITVSEAAENSSVLDSVIVTDLSLPPIPSKVIAAS